MISNVLKKSTPLNLFLIVILMLIFFSIALFQDSSWTNSPFVLIQKIGLFFILMSSIFLTNFVAKKNELSKDSSYIAFFGFIFLLFFPSALLDFNLIVSNFFLLLAFQPIIQLQSLQNTKEKIFEASLFVFVASLFHFWCILYLILIFISILLHAANDYKNWIVPFVSFFLVAIIFTMTLLFFKIDLHSYLIENTKYDLSIDYFTSIYQNIAFSIFITIIFFFIASLFLYQNNRSSLLKSSLQKTCIAFFIGLFVFVISPNKSNDVLIFTVAPLSILATCHIEMKQKKLNQEMIVSVLILCSLFTFFSQI